MQDGITTEFKEEDKMWCCMTTEDQCITTKDGDTICNGTALSLSDQCHDEYSRVRNRCTL